MMLPAPIARPDNTYRKPGWAVPNLQAPRRAAWKTQNP